MKKQIKLNKFGKIKIENFIYKENNYILWENKKIYKSKIYKYKRNR